MLAAGAAFAPRLAFAAEGIEARFPSIVKMVEGYVAQRKVPGMLATIALGGGGPGTIARGIEAFDDPDAMGLDSLYRLYSMTKPVTGMAAMMLIDEGKLRLDQPLADILPRFAKMQVQVTPDGSITELRPTRNPITIRHLLTHTAGLGYSIVQKGPLKKAYEDAGLVPGQVTKLPIPGLSQGTAIPSLERFADGLAAMPLVYEPGTRWSYSVGLDLMGRVIEVASGQSFDSFLADRIFAPLGMTSTWFQVPASETRRLTANYGILNGTPLPIDPASASIFADKPPFPMGGAGLVGSPRDYDRFLAMITGFGMLGGTRFMSEAAVRVGTSNLLPEGADTTGTFAGGSGFGAGGRVGLGDAAGQYGWGGAAGTV